MHSGIALSVRYNIEHPALRSGPKWQYFKISMRVEKLAQTVFTLLEDGAGVLLNLDTLCYYNLNRTGAAVWRDLEANTSRSLEEIVAVICDRFEVAEEAARIDARAFVEHLARFKMVRIG